jgi:hypothetical protein
VQRNRQRWSEKNAQEIPGLPVMQRPCRNKYRQGHQDQEVQQSGKGSSVQISHRSSPPSGSAVFSPFGLLLFKPQMPWSDSVFKMTRSRPGEVTFRHALVILIALIPDR